MGAHKLVWIGIVGDDVGATRNGYRIDGVRRHPYSSREFDGAVFVGVFQTNIQNRGLVAPIQTLLQLFFADAFDGHGAILPAPLRIVTRVVRQWTRRLGPSLTRDSRLGLCQGCVLVVNGPTIRPLPAVSAAQEDEPDEQVTPNSWRPER